MNAATRNLDLRFTATTPWARRMRNARAMSARISWRSIFATLCAAGSVIAFVVAIFALSFALHHQPVIEMQSAAVVTLVAFALGVLALLGEHLLYDDVRIGAG